MSQIHAIYFRDIETPPEGMDVSEWNRQRREANSTSGKKRIRFHRNSFDQSVGITKVRPNPTLGEI